MDANNANAEIEYRLNEAEALLMCARGETEQAAAIRYDMIQIVLAVRHRRPIPPTPALDVFDAEMLDFGEIGRQAVGGSALHRPR